jgi:hypothetical protein
MGATYEEVMTRAAAASGSEGNTPGSPAAVALDAIDAFFLEHAPKANEGDNGDLTDTQISALGDASNKLRTGQHVAYASPLAAALVEGEKSIISQGTLLVTGNVGAFFKNGMKAGQDAAAQLEPKADTKGFDFDVAAQWVKKHQTAIVIVGGLFTLALVTSMLKSLKDLDPLA